MSHWCVRLLHTGYQNTYFATKVRTFWGSEVILAGPHTCEGSDGFMVEGLGLSQSWSCWGQGKG